MRRLLAALLVLAGTSHAHATGILIPKEKEVPPLAMVNHQVNITIEDQVAVTNVEQVFRNHTDRQLEATYIFPVPKEASVKEFAMWIEGRKVKGEMVEADQARQIYTEIVQRTKDPGLLEYMDHKLFKLRVFPIPPKGDQKISFSYTSVVPRDNGLINYTYPLKTDGKAIQTLEKFSVKIDLKSQHSLHNIYSPTHAITVTRPNDKAAQVVFSKDQALLDRNFQLYYSAGKKDIGVTTVMHRPAASQKGYFMLLVSPRAELSKSQRVPRDVVFVLDTSGSMRGKRIEQAQSALNYCLTHLNKEDRFAIVQFASTVDKYSPNWLGAEEDNIRQAKKWVSNLEASGGTAIDNALAEALKLRSDDTSRTFTVVFFTDGQPTIGETNPQQILKNVATNNSMQTRIFTFGVGDDVNATMLDKLADQTRGVSTYVRETESIEESVSSLYNKISHPVLANLRLAIDPKIKLSEIYPPELPDLFHGSQLVVFGRYECDGHAAVTLSGSVGKEKKDFVYEVNFAARTEEEKPFVEDLWARRKVGYLLDQIRLNGESKELVEEVVTLSKRYGITTPYTSYLIVPDAPIPVASEPAFRHALPNVALNPGNASGQKGGPNPNAPLQKSVISVKDFAKAAQGKNGFEENRGKFEQEKLDQQIKELESGAKGSSSSSSKGKNGGDGKAGGSKDRNAPNDQKKVVKVLREAQKKQTEYTEALRRLNQNQLDQVQGGKLGVNLSVWNNQLRNQTQLVKSAVRQVQNRNCIELGGVWIDEGFDPKMKTVTIKALSKAYFRILEKHPEVREVFQLGNHLVWVTPSGTALILDTIEGETELPDAEIDALFLAAKKQ